MRNKLREQALPNELWAKVFTILAPASEDDAAAATFMHDYQQFHKLRLVCKQFQAIFQQQPELCSHMVVSGQASLVSAPSMLLWLSGNSSTIWSQGTVAIGALVGLICADSKLCKVDISHQRWVYNQLVVDTLPALTSLTSCRLGGQMHYEYVDVAPLKQLPKLSHVELSDGRFNNFQFLSHVTKVSFDHATVSADDFTPAPWACIGQLCELRVINSQVHKVHPQGLAGLTSLKVLECVHATISGHDDRHDLDIYLSLRFADEQLPRKGLTDLVCLSKVYLETAGMCTSGSGYIQMPGMLKHLTALQDLSIVTHSSVFCNSAFSQLSLLTQLVIRSAQDLTHDTDCRMHLGYIDWKSLHWLRNVEIGYFKFETRETIWELAELEHLDSICIQGNCADSEDTSCLAVKHHHTILKHITNV